VEKSVMLMLLDVLRIQGVSLEHYKYKIHLATGEKWLPLDAFLDGRFKEWQEQQNNENFKCKYVLSLIHLEDDKWLYAGIYKVLGVKKGVKQAYLYKTELIPDTDDLIGRIVVRYRREYRASYVWGHKYGQYLEIAEIRPVRWSVEEFPGYNQVVILHHKLKTIVSVKDQSWKSALSNVKGVYLITDTHNGKQYVGKADGSGGIWQRWVSYAKTGHGENKELRALLSKRGAKYAANFQYSILEVADSHATDEYISTREQYWKDVLLSREFGYNSN
jgi:hypothetical protein